MLSPNVARPPHVCLPGVQGCARRAAPRYSGYEKARSPDAYPRRRWNFSKGQNFSAGQIRAVELFYRSDHRAVEVFFRSELFCRSDQGRRTFLQVRAGRGFERIDLEISGAQSWRLTKNQEPRSSSNTRRDRDHRLCFQGSICHSFVVK